MKLVVYGVVILSGCILFFVDTTSSRHGYFVLI